MMLRKHNQSVCRGLTWRRHPKLEADSYSARRDISCSWGHEKKRKKKTSFFSNSAALGVLSASQHIIVIIQVTFFLPGVWQLTCVEFLILQQLNICTTIFVGLLNPVILLFLQIRTIDVKRSPFPAWYRCDPVWSPYTKAKTRENR